MPNFENELIISKDYFVLFKNKKIYYFQEQKDFNIDEIKEFVNLNFKIENLKLFFKDEISFENKVTHEFTKLKKSHLFKLFLFYIFLIIFIFLFINENSLKEQNSFKDYTNSIKSKSIEMKYNYFSLRLHNIVNATKKYNLLISEINYKFSNILLKLEVLKREDINSFLKEFDNTKVEQIVHNKSERKMIYYVSFK